MGAGGYPTGVAQTPPLPSSSDEGEAEEESDEELIQSEFVQALLFHNAKGEVTQEMQPPGPPVHLPWSRKKHCKLSMGDFTVPGCPLTPPLAPEDEVLEPAPAGCSGEVTVAEIEVGLIEGEGEDMGGKEAASEKDEEAVDGPVLGRLCQNCGRSYRMSQQMSCRRCGAQMCMNCANETANPGRPACRRCLTGTTSTDESSLERVQDDDTMGVNGSSEPIQDCVAVAVAASLAAAAAAEPLEHPITTGPHMTSDKSTDHMRAVARREIECGVPVGEGAQHIGTAPAIITIDEVRAINNSLRKGEMRGGGTGSDKRGKCDKGGKGGKGGACYKCNGIGHIARDCTAKGEGAKSKGSKGGGKEDQGVQRKSWGSDSGGSWSAWKQSKSNYSGSWSGSRRGSAPDRSFSNSSVRSDRSMVCHDRFRNRAKE